MGPGVTRPCTCVSGSSPGSKPLYKRPLSIPLQTALPSSRQCTFCCYVPKIKPSPGLRCLLAWWLHPQHGLNDIWCHDNFKTTGPTLNHGSPRDYIDCNNENFWKGKKSKFKKPFQWKINFKQFKNILKLKYQNSNLNKINVVLCLYCFFVMTHGFLILYYY